MSGWGAMAQGIGDLAGDLWNATNAHDSKVSAEDFARRRYQMMVTDLKKAGLNPMLAYMRDPGNTPQMPLPNIKGPNIMGSLVNSAQMAVAKAQTSALQSQADLNSANAAEVRSRTYGDGEFSKLKDSERYRNEASGQQADAAAAQTRALIPAMVKKANAEAEITELGIEKARNFNRAEFTAFKREVAPFLDDAVKAAGAMNSAASAISPTRIWDRIERAWESEQTQRGGRYSQRRR